MNGAPPQFDDKNEVVNDAAERAANLLHVSFGHERHLRCGIDCRPCADCRRTALLECLDRQTCGLTDFCRPCAAYWRLRLWRANHARYVRTFHRAVERYPALAQLHLDPLAAAAIFWELKQALFQDIKVWLGRSRLQSSKR
jgi:hypothetical protein